MTFEKYKKLSLKNKIIASIIILILIILSLLYFIVIPTIIDIKTMGKEIEDQRTDLERKYIKGQSLRQLTENLKKIKPKLELLDKVFVNTNRELEFITSLENEANKNRINQKINLGLPQETNNKNFQKINLQLYANGGFTRQLKYLMDIESSNYYINIKSLDLSSSPTGAPSASPDEANYINLFINADTYWK
jgi:Tfp pilus assembly protein PilO